MNYNAILQVSFYSNTIQEWLLFAAILLSAILILRTFKSTVLRRLKTLADKTETEIDDFLLEVFENKVYLYFYFLAFYFSCKYLHLSPAAAKNLGIAGKVAFSLLLISILSDCASYFFREYIFKERASGSQKKQFTGVITIANVIIWSFGLILVLDNLGVKIGALMTGMGIGGVAVALAAQAVLKDLFSYFAILFDRPFDVGDYIATGQYSGTIEYIGIKTTRIRSIDGEEIICSNSDLVEDRLRNYKRMQQRRVVFKVGLTMDTSTEKMRQMPAALERVIKSVSGITFGRAHFAAYGDYSFVYEAVYTVESPDYNVYMDKQQELNFKLKDELDKLGVRLSYPTQTVLVKN